MELPVCQICATRSNAAAVLAEIEMPRGPQGQQSPGRKLKHALCPTEANVRDGNMDIKILFVMICTLYCAGAAFIVTLGAWADHKHCAAISGHAAVVGRDP